MWPAEFWVSLSAWLALASSISCHMLTYNLTLTVICTFANQINPATSMVQTSGPQQSSLHFHAAHPASPSWHPWTFTGVQTEEATIPTQENFAAIKMRKVFSCSPWEFKTIAQDLGLPQGLQAIPLVALQTEAVSCPGGTPRTKFRLYTPKSLKSMLIQDEKAYIFLNSWRILLLHLLVQQIPWSPAPPQCLGIRYPSFWQKIPWSYFFLFKANCLNLPSSSQGTQLEEG